MWCFCRTCSQAASLAGRLTLLTKHTQLDLSHKQFGHPGAVSLAKVIGHAECPITDLNFSNSKVCDKGAVALSLSLPSSRVVTLRLYNSKVRNRGAEKLAAVLGRTSITTLDLGWNRISDIGAKYLAARVRALSSAIALSSATHVH